MSKELTMLNLRQRKVLDFGRVTNKNKEQLRRMLNNYGRGTGLNWIPKKASVRELQQYKKDYLERNAYDVLTIAIDEGNKIITHEYARDFKKTKDKDLRLLTEHGEKLAKAKYTSDRKISLKQKNFLNMSNQGVIGYGEKDIITLLENAKNKKEIDELAITLMEQDPVEEYKDNNYEIFDRVFQKVGIVRENDLDKVKEFLDELDVYEFNNAVNKLMESIEIFDSDKQNTRYGNETDLANARLDDLMIQYGIKKGISKLSKVYNNNKRV